MTTRDPYFDKGIMPERQTLLFGAAVRRQLGRWEPLVAKHTLMTLEPNLKPPPETPTVMALHEYWQGETERHLLLISVGNLLKAVKLLDDPLRVDPSMAAELIQARDLNEHWEENMPVFNVQPRPRDPAWRSGKTFAAENPQRGPYNWWAFDVSLGPLVTPHVAATQVHELVTDAIAAARATEPDMADKVPDPTPRPWVIPETPGEWWWPKLTA